MYNCLLQIFTIIQIFEQGNSQSIVMHGGSHQVANVLKETYSYKKRKLRYDRPLLLRSLI